MMIALLGALFLFSPGVGGDSWPQFRGSGARGIGSGSPPVHWNLETSENVRFRIELPGLAHSSPIVWDDKIFVTTAEADQEAFLKVGLYGAGDSVEDEGPHRFVVFCLDRQSGEILWEEVAHEGTPKVKRHPKASHASATPATDGEHVVAFFASEGLYCYDLEGVLLWQKDLGVLDAGAPGSRDYQWGFASSPILHEGHVIVQCDIQDQSFLAVFMAADGEEVWRTPRDEDPTWGTPTVDVREGRRQILVNGYKHMGGYDRDSGEELWKLVGGGDVPVPTPVVWEDRIFLTNAHGRLSPIYAIKANAEGLVTAEDDDPQMLWSYPRRGNYMQTPLVYEGLLYCCSDSGVLACYDAGTGETLYRERLGSGNTGFSASAVAADGRLYLTAEDGGIHIIKAGREFQVLGIQSMGETCMATPALVGDELLIRSRHSLVSLAVTETGGGE